MCLYCSKCTQFFALLFWITHWWEVWSSNPTVNQSLRAPSVIIGSGGRFPRSPKCS